MKIPGKHKGQATVKNGNMAAFIYGGKRKKLNLLRIGRANSENIHSLIIRQERRDCKMENGIVRKIDELGRITIPIEIRRTADVMNREKLNLSIINGVMTFTKANGEVAHSRGLDALGRYTIPKELRKTHGWNIGQEMEIYAENNQICIRKVGCEWCDNTEDLKEVKGHRICRSCGEAVKATL